MGRAPAICFKKKVVAINYYRGTRDKFTLLMEKSHDKNNIGLIGEPWAYLGFKTAMIRGRVSACTYCI